MTKPRGSTLIGALGLILFFGIAGAFSAQMATGTTSQSLNEIEERHALYIGQAGLEYALYQLEQGLDPSVENQEFSAGTFSITTDPGSELVTVTSQAGVARKVQSIQAEFSSDCVAIDTTNVYTEGTDLHGITLIKSCHQAATLSSLTFEWNWDPSVTEADPSTPLADLSSSPQNDRGALVEEVGFDSQTIYDSHLIGSPSQGAESGETIDTLDATLTSDTSYQFEGSDCPIRFSENHPGGGLYTITVAFADGSFLAHTFRDPTVPEDPGFDVIQGSIQPRGQREITVEVLGSAITLGPRGPEIPVSMWLGLSLRGLRHLQLFGGRDVDGGERYTTVNESGTAYSICALAHRGWFRRLYCSTNTLQVRTLVHGDELPRIPGFAGQPSLQDFLRNYVDGEGKIVLNRNQAIMLFELGADLRWSRANPAVDFQDLVVLFTIER